MCLNDRKYDLIPCEYSLFSGFRNTRKIDLLVAFHLSIKRPVDFDDVPFRLPSPALRSQVQDISSDITKSYLHPHYTLKQKI